MGGNASPLIADLTLAMCEFNFINQTNINTARSLTVYRYVDDVIAFNCNNFADLANTIYPPELELNQTNTSNSEANYLDIHVDMTNKSYNIYDKTNDFNFPVIKVPHRDSTIHSRTKIGVFKSELIRILRTSSNLTIFIADAKKHYKNFIDHKYNHTELTTAICNTFTKHTTQFLKGALSRLSIDCDWHQKPLPLFDKGGFAQF